MDDFAAEMLASSHGDDDRQQLHSSPSSAATQHDPTTPPHYLPGLRGGFAAFREKASLQDRLVEKYAQALPTTTFPVSSDGP